MQSIEGADLTEVEKCIAVEQIKSIAEIFDFIWENKDRWPKFMRSVKDLNKCLIDDTDIKKITLDMPFQWKGEEFVLCYTPSDPMGEGTIIQGWVSEQHLRKLCPWCEGYPKTYDDCDKENPRLLKVDIFSIKTDLASFFTIKPDSVSSESREDIEKKKQKYDEIIELLDEVLAEALDYLCNINMDYLEFYDVAFRKVNKEPIDEKNWLYFRVDHKKAKNVCCKILDELEKVLE